MKRVLFEQVKEDDNEIIIAKVTVDDLVKNGLKVDEDMEILPGFHDFDIKHNGNPLIQDIFVTDTSPGNRCINLHIVYYSNGTDINSHAFIEQDLQMLVWDDVLYFICPLSARFTKCKTVYLRREYPLFGSARFLNIK
jgi:hypothetical protein